MAISVCVQYNRFLLDLTLLTLCNTIIGESCRVFAIIVLVCLTKTSEGFRSTVTVIAADVAPVGADARTV